MNEQICIGNIDGIEWKKLSALKVLDLWGVRSVGGNLPDFSKNLALEYLDLCSNELSGECGQEFRTDNHTIMYVYQYLICTRQAESIASNGRS